MTNQPELTHEGGVVFRRDDGAAFYVLLADGELIVHAAAPDGISGSMSYEADSGNVGRLKIELRPGVPPQEIRRKP